MKKLFPFFFVFIFLHTGALGQGLRNDTFIIHSISAYKKSLSNNKDNRMVEIKQKIPSVVYDLRYATTNNFMHRTMYPQGTMHTFLRQPAVKALQKVQKKLRSMGFGLKIFDAYRPLSVSRDFWELVKDERYVANPLKGSNHNRGTAVDLTIINLITGEELPMGTGFDNFTDSAHHDFLQLPQEILDNRRLLKTIMEKAGFQSLSTEWWHYNYSNGKAYPIMDLTFTELIGNQ